MVKIFPASGSNDSLYEWMGDWSEGEALYFLNFIKIRLVNKICG